jgi:hypothetical protein
VNRYVADLHIHTALSPCASPEMTPRAIVEAAVRQGLALIAVCDHNAAGNTAAVQEAACLWGRPAGSGPEEGEGLAVIAGIEITTAEEAHVLGWFPDAAAAQAVAAEVLATLPKAVPRKPHDFGGQWLLAADGEVRGREPRLLAAASRFSLSESVRLIHRHGGLAVAAHVDRPSFSVTSQLGFIPKDAGFEALELSAAGRFGPRAAPFLGLGLPLVTGSDAHSLEEIGASRTVLTLEAATFGEVVKAVMGFGGREVRLA